MLTPKSLREALGVVELLALELEDDCEAEEAEEPEDAEDKADLAEERAEDAEERTEDAEWEAAEAEETGGAVLEATPEPDTLTVRV